MSYAASFEHVYNVLIGRAVAFCLFFGKEYANKKNTNERNGCVQKSQKCRPIFLLTAMRSAACSHRLRTKWNYQIDWNSMLLFFCPAAHSSNSLERRMKKREREREHNKWIKCHTSSVFVNQRNTHGMRNCCRDHICSITHLTFNWVGRGAVTIEMCCISHVHSKFKPFRIFSQYTDNEREYNRNNLPAKQKQK